MTLDESIQLINATTERMNHLYKERVFDEFAVVSVADKKAILLKYIGPRREDFQKNFSVDIQDIKKDLISDKHSFGDFGFAQSGTGTKMEAFLKLSDGIFLLCNHTSRSMADISQSPAWLNAQVPFVEMSEKFRSDPLIHPT